MLTTFLKKAFLLVKFFPPSLKGDESEYNEHRKVSEKPLEKSETYNKFNEQIPAEYTFSSYGKIETCSFKGFSEFLINIFGEKILKIIRTLSIAIPIIFIILVSLFFTEDENYNKTVFWGYFIIIFIFLFIIAGVITSALNYYSNSLCRLCGKKFACEEIEKPVINEISTTNKYIVTVTRHWKCKFCGQIDIREGPEDIISKKGKYQSNSSLGSIRCHNCGKKGLIEEFRQSDIKEQWDKRTTRNYYRCRNCGYIDIKLTESEIYRG